MPRIVVVDYGIGNVFSVCQAIRQAGGDAILTEDHEVIATADRLVLPGVGAFGRAIEELRRRGLEEPIKEFCEASRPFLGICVGMQVMMRRGTELGEHEGLGLIDGVVNRIPPTNVTGTRMRVPNIGWAELLRADGVSNNRWRASLLSGLAPGRSALYFLHSFSAQPTDRADLLAETDFGGHRLCAAVERGSLTGVQFHPERSGAAGQKVLRRFVAT
jgi:glutamine amidotransferase